MACASAIALSSAFMGTQAVSASATSEARMVRAARMALPQESMCSLHWRGGGVQRASDARPRRGLRELQAFGLRPGFDDGVFVPAGHAVLEAAGLDERAVGGEFDGEAALERA